MKKSNIKTLFLDIETSFSLMYSFSMYPKYIPYEQIKEEWIILCAAWKWAGEKTVYSIKNANKSDRDICETLSLVLEASDEIIYHNGAKFDWKKLNTRILLNGLPPINKPAEIDTLKQAKKHFGFTCNRLDYLGKVLGVGRKQHIGTDLWMKVTEGDPKALDAMVRYNKQDVILLEKVYNKMKPHIDIGYNRNLNGPGRDCPHCGGKVMKNGYRTTKTRKYCRLRCVQCGASSIEYPTINR